MKRGMMSASLLRPVVIAKSEAGKKPGANRPAKMKKAKMPGKRRAGRV